MNSTNPTPAEMDDVDAVAGQIRGRREGRHHPPVSVVADYRGPSADPQTAAELGAVLAHLSDRAGDLLMPHAGDLATSALSDLLAEAPLTADLLAAVTDYDRRCRQAESDAGIEVDAVDCADIATSLIELVDSGDDLDTADIVIVARHLLPGLGDGEIHAMATGLARLAREAEEILSFGVDADEIIDAQASLTEAAEDMVWRSICCTRHPNAPSSDAALVAQARRSAGHTG